MSPLCLTFFELKYNIFLLRPAMSIEIQRRVSFFIMAQVSMYGEGELRGRLRITVSYKQKIEHPRTIVGRM